MDFGKYDKNKERKQNLPVELVGYWHINSRKYEFAVDGRYYAHDSASYQLLDAGMTLVHSGTTYHRVYGDAASIVGVWSLATDAAEEWNFRADGTYTYHMVDTETFGRFSTDAGTLTTSELYAVVTEQSGVLTFDPLYQPSVSGAWSVVGDTLTIKFPTGDVLYQR